MSAKESRMMPLETTAPYFELYDVASESEKSLSELKSEIATVVMFISNHCPYVKNIQSGLVQIANDYAPKGVSFIAINSNDPESYPDDSPEKMKEDVERLNYPFPYLFDETQDVARAYGAECTPDFFVFDNELKCRYRGQFDGSRPHNGTPVTGDALRQALDAMVDGQPIAVEQIPSIGCSIKWKS